MCALCRMCACVPYVCMCAVCVHVTCVRVCMCAVCVHVCVPCAQCVHVLAIMIYFRTSAIIIMHHYQTHYCTKDTELALKGTLKQSYQHILSMPSPLSEPGLQRIFSRTRIAACLTLRLAAHIQGVQHPTMGFQRQKKVHQSWINGSNRLVRQCEQDTAS